MSNWVFSLFLISLLLSLSLSPSLPRPLLLLPLLSFSLSSPLPFSLPLLPSSTSPSASLHVISPLFYIPLSYISLHRHLYFCLSSLIFPSLLLLYIYFFPPTPTSPALSFCHFHFLSLPRPLLLFSHNSLSFFSPFTSLPYFLVPLLLLLISSHFALFSSPLLPLPFLLPSFLYISFSLSSPLPFPLPFPSFAIPFLVLHVPPLSLIFHCYLLSSSLPLRSPLLQYIIFPSLLLSLSSSSPFLSPSHSVPLLYTFLSFSIPSPLLTQMPLFSQFSLLFFLLFHSSLPFPTPTIACLSFLASSLSFPVLPRPPLFCFFLYIFHLLLPFSSCGCFPYPRPHLACLLFLLSLLASLLLLLLFSHFLFSSLPFPLLFPPTPTSPALSFLPFPPSPTSPSASLLSFSPLYLPPCNGLIIISIGRST
ncbi:hypothetical protein C7M84_000524 [Penaeus vannamei]|uniref:Uncharacterized protein n=1 Tax=Penaeus vannamei TaxID=6689 RepID=A0A3R7MG18_PENVA|nr:hypothetical protein C7M84_000524 [Penaeus vannamei]